VIPGFPASGNAAIVKVFFWTPQGEPSKPYSWDALADVSARTVVVGGTGFIVSALLLMIEVQTKWWLPNVKDLGWHSEQARFGSSERGH